MWAIEAFTGVERHHADLDLEVPRAELWLMRQHLADRLDVWTAVGGTLRPLLPGDDARGAADVVLPGKCDRCGSEQVARSRGSTTSCWPPVMPSGGSSSGTGASPGRSKMSSGVATACYLRPEVQLLLKAKGLRAKDQQDFDAAGPLLDTAAAAWLRESVAAVHPGHHWLAGLASAM